MWPLAAAWLSTGRRTWVAWLVVRAVGVANLLLVRTIVAFDVGLYGRWAAKFQGGLMPFRDFDVEYPPGIVPFLLLPAHKADLYFASFVVVALLVDAAVLRALTVDRRQWGLVLWIAAPLLLGSVFWVRLDIFVAGLLVATVRSARRGSWGWVGACTVAAAALKLWPIVLLPALLPLVPSVRRARLASAGAAVGAAAVLPLVALGASGGLLWMLRYHLDRGIEVEAMAAVPLLVARVLGFRHDIVRAHGAIEFSAESSRVLSAVSSVLLVAAVAGVVLASFRRRRVCEAGQVVWLVVIAMVVFTKVLSPQYLVWVAAIAAFVIDDQPPTRRPILGIVVAVLLLATQLLWPLSLTALVSGRTEGYVAGFFHAGAVVVFAAVATWTALRQPRPSGVIAPAAVSSLHSTIAPKPPSRR